MKVLNTAFKIPRNRLVSIKNQGRAFYWDNCDIDAFDIIRNGTVFDDGEVVKQNQQVVDISGGSDKEEKPPEHFVVKLKRIHYVRRPLGVLLHSHDATYYHALVQFGARLQYTLEHCNSSEVVWLIRASPAQKKILELLNNPPVLTFQEYDPKKPLSSQIVLIPPAPYRSQDLRSFSSSLMRKALPPSHLALTAAPTDRRTSVYVRRVRRRAIINEAIVLRHFTDTFPGKLVVFKVRSTSLGGTWSLFPIGAPAHRRAHQARSARARTHARTHQDTHTACARANANTLSLSVTNSLTHPLARSLARSLTHSHSLTHSLARSLARSLTYSHSHLHPHSHSLSSALGKRAHTHWQRMHTNALARPNPYNKRTRMRLVSVRARAPENANMCARRHAQSLHMHTHTHTNARARTHTHSRARAHAPGARRGPLFRRRRRLPRRRPRPRWPRRRPCQRHLLTPRRPRLRDPPRRHAQARTTRTPRATRTLRDSPPRRAQARATRTPRRRPRCQHGLTTIRAGPGPARPGACDSDAAAAAAAMPAASARIRGAAGRNR